MPARRRARAPVASPAGTAAAEIRSAAAGLAERAVQNGLQSRAELTEQRLQARIRLARLVDGDERVIGVSLPADRIGVVAREVDRFCEVRLKEREIVLRPRLDPGGIGDGALGGLR